MTPVIRRTAGPPAQFYGTRPIEPRKRHDRAVGPSRLAAIPHYVVLLFLYIAAFVVVAMAWFAIVFTGTYPRGMFGFVEGVFRWTSRVTAYAFTLVTDEYPPFWLAR